MIYQLSTDWADLMDEDKYHLYDCDKFPPSIVEYFGSRREAERRQAEVRRKMRELGVSASMAKICCRISKCYTTPKTKAQILLLLNQSFSAHQCFCDL